MIERMLELSGDLDDEQRARLLEIADKCPVHRTLGKRSEGRDQTRLGPPAAAGADGDNDQTEGQVDCDDLADPGDVATSLGPVLCGYGFTKIFPGAPVEPREEQHHDPGHALHNVHMQSRRRRSHLVWVNNIR